MAKDYAVTIRASEVAIESETLARRLADLLKRSIDEVDEALREGTVVIQRELRYAEAIEIQRELLRREIPTAVSAHSDLNGREMLLIRRDADAEAATMGAEGDRIAGEDDDLSGWAELFPDLVKETEGGAGPEAGEPLLRPDEVDRPEAMPPVGATEGEEPKNKRHNHVAPVDAEPASLHEKSRSSPGDPEQPRFAAEKIEAAFGSKARDRPPYKPKGFDQRTPHLPLLAALLSAVAPGAGQIYNGQADKSQWYGTMFFLLYPWFDAVRQAWKRGKKIRSYYAPRPEEGVGRRVASYAVKWWIAVGAIALLSGATISMVQDHLEAQRAHRQALVLQETIFATEQTVAVAVERGRRAADDVEIAVEDEDDDRGRYTMDDDERARRLFVMGYHYCAAGEFEMCEQTMRRVSILAPHNRDARRLQAWSSMQARGAEPEDMPRVEGQVPTLEQLELELATRGVDLDELDPQFQQWWNEVED